MKEFAIFLMFVGMLIIVHSIYEEKFRELKSSKDVQYKFIPRSELYDQLYTDAYQKYNRALFNDDIV